MFGQFTIHTTACFSGQYLTRLSVASLAIHFSLADRAKLCPKFLCTDGEFADVGGNTSSATLMKVPFCFQVIELSNL